MSGCCGRSTPPTPPGPSPLPQLNVASAQEMARKQFKETEDPFVIERRIQSCQSCPYFNRDKSVCNKCGCFMVAKIGVKHDRCPINRW